MPYVSFDVGLLNITPTPTPVPPTAAPPLWGCGLSTDVSPLHSACMQASVVEAYALGNGSGDPVSVANTDLVMIMTTGECGVGERTWC